MNDTHTHKKAYGDSTIYAPPSTISLPSGKLCVKIFPFKTPPRLPPTLHSHTDSLATRRYSQVTSFQPPPPLFFIHRNTTHCLCCRRGADVKSVMWGGTSRGSRSPLPPALFFFFLPCLCVCVCVWVGLSFVWVIACPHLPRSVEQARGTQTRWYRLKDGGEGRMRGG